MRVCSSCGRENPDDRDFCECGEYLRWEPTGVVQAITPEVPQPRSAGPGRRRCPPAQPDARRARPATTGRRTPPPAPHRPRAPAARGRQPAPAAARCRRRPLPSDRRAARRPAPRRRPAAAGRAGAARAEPDPAAISLRLPEGEQVNLGETLAVGVEPGQRARVLALVRNQSGIVDNYELSVRGLPDDWWSIYPNTVYLVPFGTGGTYEQEVEIHLHPPRTRRGRGADLGARGRRRSKAYTARPPPRRCTSASSRSRSSRPSSRPSAPPGRKKAQYDVAVENTANAPVTVALDAADPDNELDYGFTPATMEIPPGQSIESKMLVRPPQQKLDRPPGGEAHPGLHQDRRGGRAGQDRRRHGAARGRGRRGRRGRRGTPTPARAAQARLRITGPRAQVGTSGVRMSGPARAAEAEGPEQERRPDEAQDARRRRAGGRRCR